MEIHLVTPAPPGSRTGNRRTALRWAGLLRELGHAVRVAETWDGARADLLVALHARRSAEAVRRWRERRPGAPLVVGLAGTDLYRDLDPAAPDADALASLEAATLLVGLHDLAAEQLPAAHRAKVRVVLQSVRAPRRAPRPPRPSDGFDVCVLAHLREVKDPLLAARAARSLPARSRVRVVHAGGALEPGLAARARAEERENPRYRWLGELPRWRAMRRLTRCRALALTSRMEGGANVVSEAVVWGVPVLSTRIPGSLGLLGRDYPGTFPVGDAGALTELLLRSEDDERFLDELASRCRELAPRFAPERERAAWSAVLAEL